ncbi:uncharacterized protein Smp_202520 [Schistosoma mansoni]|uniref:uncharacterized protein n=1 Tax=Schistosoma mansoni TaxID=6183 RepID=UPI00022DC19A|nr:uncharacterized protein Smp_202520 [Schistosoma mansoni]|eukprot:XP_018652011.1 uncharacterized protein Smp_202520 [Schistosoma mansoni]
MYEFDTIKFILTDKPMCENCFDLTYLTCILFVYKVQKVDVIHKLVIFTSVIQY